jgi:hypothetical protein
MGVVTPATTSPPLATSVAEEMVVLLSTALAARSVQDTRVPGVAAPRTGNGAGPLLPPHAEIATVDPLISAVLRIRNFVVRRMVGLQECLSNLAHI